MSISYKQAGYKWRRKFGYRRLSRRRIFFCGLSPEEDGGYDFVDGFF